MTKVHIHSEEFDGVAHAWCGRGKTAVTEYIFETIPFKDRCKICDKEWFPNGQPDWHYENAVYKAQLLTSHIMLQSIKEKGLMQNLTNATDYLLETLKDSK